MNYRLLCWVLSISPWLITPVTAGETTGYQFVHEGDSIGIFHQQQLVLRYQLEAKSQAGKATRSNYIHPLIDLNGNEITEDFPPDHLHHRGIFWAWHQTLVNGIAAGDPWECRNFVWEHQQANWRVGVAGKAHLLVATIWKSPLIADAAGQPVPLVEEVTQLTLSRPNPALRILDFNIQLQALVNGIQLGGSDDDKGYGGFSPRIKLPADVLFHGPQGIVQPQRTAVDAGSWIALNGHFGDHTTPSGIAIIGHRNNPVYPEQWILRKANSMQNAAFPGRVPRKLQVGKPWLLRYRLVLHSGRHNPDLLNQLERRFR